MDITARPNTRVSIEWCRLNSNYREISFFFFFLDQGNLERLTIFTCC